MQSRGGCPPPTASSPSLCRWRATHEVLSEADRWALVAHLETLSVDFSEDEAPVPEAVSAPPAVTPALLAHGKELFDGRGCPGCHGPAGKGDGPAAAALRDSAGRPVKPRDLTGPFYHRGSELPDIYRTLRTGLDGTPMASFAALLTADDTWAVAAYVHSLAPAHAPGPGGLECLVTHGSPDPEELAGVRIVMHGLTAPAP